MFMIHLTYVSIRANYTISDYVNYLITPWLCPNLNNFFPRKDPNERDISKWGIWSSLINFQPEGMFIVPNLIRHRVFFVLNSNQSKVIYIYLSWKRNTCFLMIGYLNFLELTRKSKSTQHHKEWYIMWETEQIQFY